jgi:hypothetical protein
MQRMRLCIGDGTLYQSDVWVYTITSSPLGTGTWQWVGGDIPVGGANNGARGVYSTGYSFGGRLWPVLAIDGTNISTNPCHSQMRFCDFVGVCVLRDRL